jgi:protein-arginine kinase activator protein McsA
MVCENCGKEAEGNADEIMEQEFPTLTDFEQMVCGMFHRHRYEPNAQGKSVCKFCGKKFLQPPSKKEGQRTG